MARWGTITEFWHVFSEINPEALRHEAERPCRLLLLGGAGAGKSALGRALAGDPANWFRAQDVLVELTTQENSWGDWPAADLSIYITDATRGITEADRMAIDRLRRSGRAFVILINKCDLTDNLAGLQYEWYAALGDVPSDRIVFGTATRDQLDESLSRAILAGAPGLRLALARRLPPLRRIVGDELIAEAARVNAEFALLSNLPSNIPLIGGLLGGGADFLVLTKNQAMLIFKLAAIHGRDLGAKPALIAEVAPVVGAAFLWRTLAREAIGLLPSVVAAAPKTAIGYAGTFVVGKMAQYYYAFGRRPSADVVQRFREEAMQRLRLLRTRLPGRGNRWPSSLSFRKRRGLG